MEQVEAVFHESIFRDKSSGEIVIDHGPLRTFIEFITSYWRAIEKKSFAPIATLCVESFGEEHRPKSLALFELKLAGTRTPTLGTSSILVSAMFSDEEGLSSYGAYHFKTSFVVSDTKPRPKIRIREVLIDGVW